MRARQASLLSNCFLTAAGIGPYSIGIRQSELKSAGLHSASVSVDGIGHSHATLYDTTGMVGTGATAQFLDQVAAPFAQAAKLTGELG